MYTSIHGWSWFITWEPALLPGYYSSKLEWLHFTFTCHAVDVTELVSTATVALVGAVHVGTLLTAWVALTFIQVYREKLLSQTIMDFSLQTTTPLVAD